MNPGSSRYLAGAMICTPLPRLVILASLLCLTACDSKSGEKGAPAKGSDSEVKKAETEVEKDDFEKDAEQLIATFASSLKGSLQAGMKMGGPVGAIGLCSAKAPSLAAELEGTSLKIRRIGTRTRNPKNAPSKEDQEILKSLSKEKPVVSKEGRYYKAIFTGPLCMSCHGPKESLSSDVLAALKEEYPKDAATGYAAGELRGAFVVESK